MNTGIYSKIKAMSPQFLVTDINSSIEFYTNKSGFDVDFRYEDFYAGVTKDEYCIHLKLAKPAIEERENKINNEHLDIVFSVDEIEVLYDNLRTQSVEFIKSLREMPYGKEFYIADPDGYIIAFIEGK